MRTTIRLTAIAALLVTPLIVSAQGPARGRVMAPGAPGAPGELGTPSVTRILNARRVLDLTPRQVAQLDSIERSVYAERRTAETRMRALRDSIREQVGAQGAPTTDAERTQRREAVRTRLEALRPQMQQLRGRDSTARAAANRVLNDAQRQQLREIQAEERGRQRGLREARMRDGGGMRGGRVMQPRRGVAPGGEAAPGEMRRRQMIEREAQGDRRPAPPRPDVDG
jgi:hypothetical protein